MNRELIYGDANAARFGYSWETNFGGKASDCVECGQCQSVCPQKIKIIDTLKIAKEKYENA
jgi:predicted aldo/keto reductase-like oxidoreductase